MSLKNWQTQIRKGYLELCILEVVDSRQRAYGFELYQLLSEQQLVVQEGTLYPLLSRMAQDKLLKFSWESQPGKGHPRKFYSLTTKGAVALGQMRSEFQHMVDTYFKLSDPKAKKQKVVHLY